MRDRRSAVERMFHYQDGDKYTQNDGVVYINGFDSPSALNTFIEDLHGCVNRSEAMAAHQREER